MDKAAKRAGLDKKQWDNSVRHSLKFAKECDKINRVEFCHTINSYQLFIKFIYRRGREVVWYLGSRAEDKEFKLYKILAKNVFKQVKGGQK